MRFGDSVAPGAGTAIASSVHSGSALSTVNSVNSIRKKLQSLFAASICGKKPSVAAADVKSKNGDDAEEQSSTQSSGKKNLVKCKKGGVSKSGKKTTGGKTD